MNQIITSIANNPIKKTTATVLVVIDGVILLLCLFCREIITTFFLWLTISAIVDGTVWLIVGSVNKCPYCGATFAMKKIGMQLIGEKQSTMRVQNRVRDRYGYTIARVDDNIPAIKREYLNTYKCMHCGRTKQNTSYTKTRD